MLRYRARMGRELCMAYNKIGKKLIGKRAGKSVESQMTGMTRPWTRPLDECASVAALTSEIDP